MSNINTKFLLRIDSWTNWNNATTADKGANLVLLKGEIGLCEFASGQKDPTTGVPVKPAAVLFKVGDGTSKFSELKWASALAADVYDWAKQSENDFVNTFLNLKMNDGTTMQTKLDGVFATDAELASAIAALRLEIPTQLGVMSVKATGDTEITMTPTTAASGEVTVTAAHTTHAAGSAKTASTQTVSGYSGSGTIKIPKIVTNAAGHVTEITEETVTITMPAAQTLPTVNDGTLTLKASTGLTADQKTFTANDVDNVTFEVKHGAKPTTGNQLTADTGSGRTYVTRVDVDNYGHIAKVYTATETDQDLSGYQPKGDYKTKQTAVDLDAAKPEGSSLLNQPVITGIQQNDNGVITGIDSYVPEIKLSGVGTSDTASVPTEDSVSVVTALSRNVSDGLNLMGGRAQVPTKAYVDKTVAGAVAGAVDYLGVVNSAADLANKTLTATHGDFVRVATAFGNYHNGDLLIYNKPASGTATWDIIHGEEGDITNVIAGNGLTGGGSVGEITISHDDTSSVESVAKANRTYVSGITFDGFGHVTAIERGTETVTDTWRPVKAGGNSLENNETLELLEGSNVTISENGGKVTINSTNISLGGTINGGDGSPDGIQVPGAFGFHPGNKLTYAYYTAASKAGLDLVKDRLDDLEAIELDASGVTNDGVVTESLTGSAIEDGKLKLSGKIEHAKKGPTSEFIGTAAAATADAWSESVSIKVPKIKVDTYGHTTEASEITYKVQLPANPVLALDYADTAVDKQFVTEVDQTDGKISVKRGPVSAYDLAEAGKTPVTQQDYLVFYGGTSTDVV